MTTIPGVPITVLKQKLWITKRGPHVTVTCNFLLASHKQSWSWKFQVPGGSEAAGVMGEFSLEQDGAGGTAMGVCRLGSSYCGTMQDCVGCKGSVWCCSSACELEGCCGVCECVYMLERGCWGKAPWEKKQKEWLAIFPAGFLINFACGKLAGL